MKETNKQRNKQTRKRNKQTKQKKKTERKLCNIYCVVMNLNG